MENGEMKDRIAHIIRAKNLTAAEFALRLGIQPSNISHLLSGRNNPSLEFVKKLKETFPEYSLDWVIFGRGPITVSEPFTEPAPIAKETPPDEPKEPELGFDDTPGTLFAQPVDEAAPQQPAVVATDAPLQKIILVYADHSFEVLQPR